MSIAEEKKLLRDLIHVRSEQIKDYLLEVETYMAVGEADLVSVENPTQLMADIEGSLNTLLTLEALEE